MKLNDIFTNLKNTIDISGKTNKDFKLSPILSKNIDSFNLKLKKTLKINKPKKIIIKKNKKNIDNLTNKKTKKINLKDIIKNKTFLNLIKEKISFFFIKYNNKKSYKKNNFLKVFTFLLIFLLLNFILASFFLFYSYNSLKKLNLENYKKQIIKSKIGFKISKNLFIPFYIIPNNNLKSFYYLASAGENFSKFIKIYTNIINQNINSKIFLTDIIKENKVEIQKSYLYLEAFKNNLNQVTIKNFNKVLDITNFLNILLKDFKENPDRLLYILGDKNIQKYLILFQNNDELRATGGFPGSVGIISIYKGKIIDFKKEDIYALEWNINKNYKNKIKAPEGINKINPYFTLKDSNYFSSYFSSANSLNFFLQKGEYSFDGIIFINTNTINEILDTIGGIYFDKINTKINSSNFNEVLSILVESKISKKGTLGTPKQILFDFSKKLENKIKNKDNLLKISKILLENIKNREIAIINFNPYYNKLFQKLGLNGEVNFDKYKNFIYPIFTSISQNKSDRYLNIQYKIKTNIQKNKNNKCDYITNFNLTLKHGFDKKNEEIIKNYIKKFNIKEKEKILEIQGKGNNKQFIRFIIPKQTFIKANVFYNIFKNKNTNLIEFYTNIKPQENAEINFNYIQKNKDCNNYNFILIKQPGIKNYNLKYTLIKYGKIIKNLNFKKIKKDFYYIEK